MAALFGGMARAPEATWAKRVTVNGPLVARFLEENATEERIFLQRQRDQEAQSLRDALLGTKVIEEKEPEPREEIELDLTKLFHAMRSIANGPYDVRDTGTSDRL